MDADDVAMPERIELQLAYLTAHPEIAAVGSALRQIDKDGQQIAQPTRYPSSSDEIRRGLLLGYSTLAQPTVAMRRDTALAVGGYRPAFDTAEDFDLWLRLSERYRLRIFLMSSSTIDGMVITLPPGAGAIRCLLVK